VVAGVVPGVVAGRDVNWDALWEVGTLAEVDALCGEVDTLETAWLADVGAVAEDVSAAGLVGVVVFPVKEVRAKAVAPDSTRSTPMIQARTTGRHRLRRGWGLAGIRYAPPGGGG
jgi:hypothetical protein